jgi:argininosuccinate lyase
MVGSYVGWCAAKGIGLDQTTVEQMRETIPLASQECLELFSAQRSVAGRDITGGTAPDQVVKQLDFWRRRLAD